MDGRKSRSNVMDQRRRKSATPIWKPVHTQCSSSGESMVDELKMEVEELRDADKGEIIHAEGQYQEAHLTISNAASNAENLYQERDVTEPTDTNLSSGRSSEPYDKKYSLSVLVGASLMRFIKGKGGSMQQTLEEEMGIKIIFPSSNNVDSLLIEGMSAESVTKASEKIESIIEEVTKSSSVDYSHFISLPLAVHPELVDKLFNFQRSILGASNSDKSENLEDFGIDKSIFINPKTFHLTVLMLKLWNRDRVVAATEVLQKISSKVLDALDRRPISIRLKGLACMKGSSTKARVLYAPVEEVGGEGRLELACQIIIDAFVEAGLVLEKDAQQKLKMHATIMNARHRKWKWRMKKMDTFDARDIFKQYGSEDWGEYIIGEAHLSQRFVFDENGYYRCCCSIPLP
ncbi:activating signal cointegrator 1 complex subunit 1 isoform X3 [Impatiens glandulifera]|uniref:activating signal cointegrator 1 complex subunit 1 isoform X3 n=1 Tax=Impatiens glandulifera TaxID=253017 RepID=UPI001FB163C9|nr:activating signal cointegrator 1 complex subunit 1 isoform X3 [Impatiens glandulifera]